jgi:Apea-like HEPN
MNPERALFAFFPYLITLDRPRIRGIEFRSNEDIADLPKGVQDHLATLCEMFFLQDGVRIEKMVCAYIELPKDRGVQEDLLRAVHEARLLVGYLYSHPSPSGDVFLHSQNSTLYVFHPGSSFHPGMVPTHMVWQGQGYGDRLKRIDDREIPNEMLIPGYTGTRDQDTYLTVAKGSRIYPEVPYLVVNHSQNLALNLQTFLSYAHNWALWTLYVDRDACPPELRHRVFVAIDWYMRSCRDSLVEAEAIVHLAIAFESLLNVGSEEEGVRARLKNAILTLVGRVPRLDEWVEQFYTARSAAVHEGMPSDLMFYPPAKAQPASKASNFRRKKTAKDKEDEKQLPHRSLMAYGRRVFRLCLSSMLAGAMQARISRLDALFVPNTERIEQIQESLTKTQPATKCIWSVEGLVADLSDYTSDILDPDRVPAKDAVWMARLALQSLKEAVPTISEAGKKLIGETIKSVEGDPTVAMLDKIAECAKQLRSETGSPDQSEPTRLTRIVIAILDYASRPGYKAACYVREHPELSKERT